MMALAASTRRAARRRSHHSTPVSAGYGTQCSPPARLQGPPARCLHSPAAAPPAPWWCCSQTAKDYLSASAGRAVKDGVGGRAHQARADGHSTPVQVLQALLKGVGARQGGPRRRLHRGEAAGWHRVAATGGRGGGTAGARSRLPRRPATLVMCRACRRALAGGAGKREGAAGAWGFSWLARPRATGHVNARSHSRDHRRPCAEG